MVIFNSSLYAYVYTEERRQANLIALVSAFVAIKVGFTEVKHDHI
jgi:uncharacterized membrane protein